VKDFIKLLEAMNQDAEIIAPTLDCISTIGANDYGEPYLNDGDKPEMKACKDSTSIVIF
jgi:hypothetical protein